MLINEVSLFIVFIVITLLFLPLAFRGLIILFGLPPVFWIPFIFVFLKGGSIESAFYAGAVGMLLFFVYIKWEDWKADRKEKKAKRRREKGYIELDPKWIVTAVEKVDDQWQGKNNTEEVKSLSNSLAVDDKWVDREVHDIPPVKNNVGQVEGKSVWNGNGLKKDIFVTLPEGLPATEEPTEQALLQRFHSCSSDEDLIEIVWALIGFYNDIKRDDLANSLIEMLVERLSHSDRAVQ